MERRNNGDINEDYNSLMLMLHEIAKEIIPKKQVCRHSKGWWNAELTRLSKEYKKAKRYFAKRCDEANEKRLKELLGLFKEEESKARSQHMDEMVKMLDPKKPSQFWKIINRARKEESKGVVQPIKREAWLFQMRRFSLR